MNMYEGDLLMSDARRESKQLIQKTSFVRICGMLGSDHDGERASAALQATKLLKQAGLTWEDLLGSIVDTEAAQGENGWPKTKTARHNGASAYDVVGACYDQDLSECGSDWDEDFILDLADRRKKFGHRFVLTEKQWKHVWRIATDLGLVQDGRFVG